MTRCFSKVDKLPNLPDVAPLASQQREYKNYQKLRMEILRRDPDASLPALSQSPPPAMVRRNTNPVRPNKLLVPKKAAVEEVATIPEGGSPEPPAVHSKLRAQIAQILEYPDGSRYIGDSVAGRKHGKVNLFSPFLFRFVLLNTCQGFLVYCDGSSFVGEFVQGKRNGLGMRTNPKTKDVFRGFYANDQKHGFGWFFGEDGSESYYFYVANELHGVGSFRWPRGTVEDREFVFVLLMLISHVFDWIFS